MKRAQAPQPTTTHLLAPADYCADTAALHLSGAAQTGPTAAAGNHLHLQRPHTHIRHQQTLACTRQAGIATVAHHYSAAAVVGQVPGCCRKPVMLAMHRLHAGWGGLGATSSCCSVNPVLLWRRALLLLHQPDVTQPAAAAPAAILQSASKHACMLLLLLPATTTTHPLPLLPGSSSV